MDESYWGGHSPLPIVEIRFASQLFEPVACLRSASAPYYIASRISESKEFGRGEFIFSDRQPQILQCALRAGPACSHDRNRFFCTFGPASQEGSYVDRY